MLIVSQSVCLLRKFRQIKANISEMKFKHVNTSFGKSDW